MENQHRGRRAAWPMRAVDRGPLRAVDRGPLGRRAAGPLGRRGQWAAGRCAAGLLLAKPLQLWAKSLNDFGNFGRHFPCATSAKILAAMYARVPQAMAQFVLKIEKLSHIMAPTPILEMARAYGVHPRLWLLLCTKISCKTVSLELSVH